MDFVRCSLHIASDRSAVIYEAMRLDDVDAIVPRIGSSHAAYGAAVVQQFQLMGVASTNSAEAIRCAHDKLRCLQLLAAEGVGLPATGFAHASSDLIKLVDAVGGAPLIVKLLGQEPGGGILLANTPASAEAVIEAFQGLDARSLVQEFIEQAAGISLRCLVIADRVVAAVERRAPAGEFRSNLHRGGKAFPVKLSALETATALRAANTLGLQVAGVDLLQSPRGPLVIGVNSTPELESIQRTTGIDVAEQIFAHLESRLVPKAPREPSRRFDYATAQRIELAAECDTLASAALELAWLGGNQPDAPAASDCSVTT